MESYADATVFSYPIMAKVPIKHEGRAEKGSELKTAAVVRTAGMEVELSEAALPELMRWLKEVAYAQ